MVFEAFSSDCTYSRLSPAINTATVLPSSGTRPSVAVRALANRVIDGRNSAKTADSRLRVHPSKSTNAHCVVSDPATAAISGARHGQAILSNSSFVGHLARYA